MKNKLKLFGILLWIGVGYLQAQGTQNFPHHLQGCWLDMRDKEWKYGFFEKFAVIGNDFWEYHSIRGNEGNIEVVLRKENELRPLRIENFATDSLCVDVVEKNKKLRLFRALRHPGYLSEDTVDYVDNGYQKDSVTLIGCFRENTLRTLPVSVEIQLPYYIGHPVRHYADIDSLGRFRITIPVLNTTEIGIDSQPDGANIRTVVEPGETLFIYYDRPSATTFFMGKNSRLHQEIAGYWDYYRQWGNRWIDWYDALDDAAYLAKKKEWYAEGMLVGKRYQQDYPHLSTRCKLYIHASLLFLHGNDVAFTCNAARRNSPEIVNYLTERCYQHLPKPYTLAKDILNFLSTYHSYYNNMRGNLTNIDVEAIRYLNETGQYSLSLQQQKDLKDFESFRSVGVFSMLCLKMDSVEVFQRIKVYQEGSQRTEKWLLEDSVLQNKLQDCYSKMSKELEERNQLRNSLVCLDSLKNIPSTLRELLTTSIFYQTLEQKKIPLFSLSLEEFDKLVTNPSLREALYQRQGYYEALTNKAITYEKSLKKNDNIKEFKDAVILWQKLIEPYKGKVIYVDFWGTWCGVCIGEIQTSVPAILEAMKGKDVIFMYFADNTPEKNWKNFIKQNKLSGTQIVHYNLPKEQQNLLKRHFDIHSFPTYMLINRAGVIIDRHPPRPSEKVKLIEKLNQL